MDIKDKFCWGQFIGCKSQSYTKNSPSKHSVNITFIINANYIYLFCNVVTRFPNFSQQKLIDYTRYSFARETIIV